MSRSRHRPVHPRRAAVQRHRRHHRVVRDDTHRCGCSTAAKTPTATAPGWGSPTWSTSRSSSCWSASSATSPTGPQPTLAPFAHLGIEMPTQDDVDEIAELGRADGCLAWEPQQLPAAHRLRVRAHRPRRQRGRVQLRPGRVRQGARGVGRARGSTATGTSCAKTSRDPQLSRTPFVHSTEWPLAPHPLACSSAGSMARPSPGSPGAGVYGGNLHHEVARVARRPSMALQRFHSGGAARSARRSGQRHVPAPRSRPRSPRSASSMRWHAELSASVAWFGAVYRYAARAGHPRSGAAGAHAHHRHLVAGRVATARRRRRAGRRPSCWRPCRRWWPPARPVDPVDVLHSMVDRLCRLTLVGRAAGARASPRPAPSTRARSAWSVVRSSPRPASSPSPPSWAKPSPTSPPSSRSSPAAPRASPSCASACASACPARRPTTSCGMHRHHDADASRERLGGDWPLGLELVDGDDRGRWCTADQVTAGGPGGAGARARRALPPAAAAPAARGRRGHRRGRARAGRLARHDRRTPPASISTRPPPRWRASTRSPPSASSCSRPRSSPAAAPSTRATAQPKDAAGSGRFAATALVDWQVVVDNTPVPDDVLRRAAEDGANLIQVGGRWVQIDRAEARRALANLQEHRTEHGEMSALAAAHAGGRAAARARGRRPRRPTTPAPTCVQATGWAGELLDGLPDEALADGDVPDTASPPRCGRTSGAAWAGCSSCTASASAAAWPTTWAWARPPPRSPTSPACPGRTWWSARCRWCATGRPRPPASRRSCG